MANALLFQRASYLPTDPITCSDLTLASIIGGGLAPLTVLRFIKRGMIADIIAKIRLSPGASGKSSRCALSAINATRISATSFTLRYIYAANFYKGLATQNVHSPPVGCGVLSMPH